MVTSHGSRIVVLAATLLLLTTVVGCPSSGLVVGWNDAGVLDTDCPPESPVDRAACSSWGLVCEYDNGSRATSRDCLPARECTKVLSAATDDGFRLRWFTTKCTPPSAKSCPERLADVAVGTKCSRLRNVCEYESGTCGCRAEAPSDTWICVPAPEAPNCPGTRPRAGAPCSGGAVCDYGSTTLAGGMKMFCNGRSWQIYGHVQSAVITGR